MKSKSAFILIFFLVSGLTSFCKESTLRNRLALSAFSYKFVNKNMDYIVYSDNQLNLLNGLAYSRAYENIGIRFSMGFIWDNNEVLCSGADCLAGNIYSNIWSFSSGIQTDYSIKKFDAFMGMDLYYTQVIQKYDLCGGAVGECYLEKVNDNWLGISPFIGLRYNISTRFSVSIEASYNFEVNVYSTRVEQDPQYVLYQNYFNPINAIYLGYSF